MWVLAAKESDSVPVEAVVAGAIAVVLAAVIALIGVLIQTSKTLKAERTRLDDQLKAERDRLKLQLSHDRATRERDDLRQVLDSAAAALDDTAIAAIEVSRTCEQVLKQDPPPDPDDNERELTEVEKQFFAELGDLFERLRKLDIHTTQIAMRLGPEHEIKRLYRASRDQIGLLHRSLIDLEVEKEDEILGRAGSKKRQFEASAAELIGSNLD